MNYECTAERFASDVSFEHVMQIIRDDETGRHIKFKFDADAPFRWFEIITWRGHLYIGGDCETFVFKRTEDMFEFFRCGFNPTYWQEKITDGRERAQKFDVESFKTRAHCHFTAWLAVRSEYNEEEQSDLQEDFDTALDDVEDEASAIMFFRDFSCDGFNFNDWEIFPGQEFTYQYIWVCRAIAWAIQQYDAARSA